MATGWQNIVTPMQTTVVRKPKRPDLVAKLEAERSKVDKSTEDNKKMESCRVCGGLGWTQCTNCAGGGIGDMSGYSDNPAPSCGACAGTGMIDCQYCHGFKNVFSTLWKELKLDRLTEVILGGETGHIPDPEGGGNPMDPHENGDEMYIKRGPTIAKP